MKIIGGEWRGRNFFMPGWIRPTQNILRKAIFDMIGQDMVGLQVLELYAGSGAVGMEALSRGATRVTMVEKDPKCVDLIVKNLQLLGSAEDVRERAEILAADALMTIKQFASQGRKFDLVFFDPPFERDLAKKTLKTIGAYDIVTADSLVIAQSGEQETLPEAEGRFSLIRQKRYGNSYLSIYQGVGDGTKSPGPLPGNPTV